MNHSMNHIVQLDVGVHMVSGKVNQFGSHFLLTYCCLLFATAMYVSCPLSAVSTEMGERSFRLEFSPNLSSSTQTRCVLLGLHPTTPTPATPTPPSRLPLPPFVSPSLKVPCPCVPPSFRLRPGLRMDCALLLLLSLWALTGTVSLEASGKPSASISHSHLIDVRCTRHTP